MPPPPPPPLLRCSGVGGVHGSPSSAARATPGSPSVRPSRAGYGLRHAEAPEPPRCAAARAGGQLPPPAPLPDAPACDSPAASSARGATRRPAGTSASEPAPATAQRSAARRRRKADARGPAQPSGRPGRVPRCGCLPAPARRLLPGSAAGDARERVLLQRDPERRRVIPFGLQAVLRPLSHVAVFGRIESRGHQGVRRVALARRQFQVSPFAAFTLCSGSPSVSVFTFSARVPFSAPAYWRIDWISLAPFACSFFGSKL